MFTFTITLACGCANTANTHLHTPFDGSSSSSSLPPSPHTVTRDTSLFPYQLHAKHYTSPWCGMDLISSHLWHRCSHVFRASFPFVTWLITKHHLPHHLIWAHSLGFSQKYIFFFGARYMPSARHSRTHSQPNSQRQSNINNNQATEK